MSSFIIRRLKLMLVANKRVKLQPCLGTRAVLLRLSSFPSIHQLHI